MTVAGKHHAQRFNASGLDTWPALEGARQAIRYARSVHGDQSCDVYAGNYRDGVLATVRQIGSSRFWRINELGVVRHVR